VTSIDSRREWLHVLETIDHIADAPQRMGKPLQLELEGLWIARRGQYSVLNRIDEERHVVEIVTIEPPRDVYRGARRG